MGNYQTVHSGFFCLSFLCAAVLCLTSPTSGCDESNFPCSVLQLTSKEFSRKINGTASIRLEQCNPLLAPENCQNDQCCGDLCSKKFPSAQMIKPSYRTSIGKCICHGVYPDKCPPPSFRPDHAPLQVKETNTSSSVLDPCQWADCGSGSCNNTSTFTYNCVCGEGFYNLLNVSSFPCFQECGIGLDYASLGITCANKSGLAVNGNSQAGLKLLEGYHWFIILLVSLAMVN